MDFDERLLSGHPSHHPSWGRVPGPERVADVGYGIRAELDECFQVLFSVPALPAANCKVIQVIAQRLAAVNGVAAWPDGQGNTANDRRSQDDNCPFLAIPHSFPALLNYIQLIKCYFRLGEEHLIDPPRSSIEIALKTMVFQR
jgi:hypothetical protein